MHLTFSLLGLLLGGGSLVLPAAAQVSGGEAEKAAGYSRYDIERAIDTALTWFDRAVPTLQEAGVADVDEFRWKLDKGRFIQEHQKALPDLQDEAYELYREAYKLDPARLEPYYIKMIIYDYVRQGDKQDALDFMGEVEENLAEPNEDLEAYMDAVHDQLLNPHSGHRITDHDTENVDLMVELFDIYRKPQMRDEALELSNRLIETAPSARTYRIMGEVLLDDGEARRALDMVQHALEQDDAEEHALEIYYDTGIAYQQLGHLLNARTAFRKALEADSTYGQALIEIGDLYTTQVAECADSKLTPEDQAVYWLAADYYEWAKAVDPSVTQTANLKLQNVRPYFPDFDTMFPARWNTGDTYDTAKSGPCYGWIDEATTVR